MAGLTDLLGRNGVLEQLLLYNVVGQAVSAMLDPAFTALQQDALAKHPDIVLTPDVLASLVARHIVGQAQAEADAAKSGIAPARFALLLAAAKVRLAPADLAEAVLRSYMTLGDAEAEAKPQGIDAGQLAILRDLAGDAPGPQQLAEALRRGIIDRYGTGADSTSFQQGIAESRLHDKWAEVVDRLAAVLLTPADAAETVVRNFLDRAAATERARLAGVDQATFELMILLAGDAPGPQQLAEALRRGLIDATGTGADSTSFQQGIAEGRLADKWAHVIQGLARLWPTPTDALEAALKGQLTDQEGRDTYQLLGGDPQFYQWLLDSIGDAPSPLEAASMAARGIIDWQGTGPDVLSFEQAIREGRLRNKWTNAVRAVTRYLPPPGEVITFLAHGAITVQRATQFLADHDMEPDVLAAFLNEAELTALSEYRGLTQQAVVDMYYAHLIDATTATAILELLHVSPKAAPLLLAYADLRQEIDSIQRSVQRIAQLFTGRKIGLATAQQALIGLGIPAPSVEKILQTWEIQAQANVKTLTQAEIVTAWYKQILPTDIAIAELAAIGYTDYDAWVLLSIKAGGPLPGQPPRDVAAPPGTVIPGVT